MPNDIVVTTPKSSMKIAAQEAQNCIAAGGGSYFRRFHPKLRPSSLGPGSKIFYVEDGYIRGYAVVSSTTIATKLCGTTGIEWPFGYYAIMPANSWKWIEPIPMKSFQGYRYFTGEYKIVGDWTDPKPTI